LTPASIADLLQPYLIKTDQTNTPPPDWPRIYEQLAIYLDLIQRWNARINLTAIRSPEEIVRRHFGESLFVGSNLGMCATLLDFGSGAGFPGVPIQLLRPDVKVTLAESRNRKSAFLKELARCLDLPAEIWPGRVESMPASRQFDAVALRAVDEMESAVREASIRAKGRLLIIGTRNSVDYPNLADQFAVNSPISLPESKDGVLLIAHRRENVPRGTF
jgi:16S rRNA (guanine527-N7)-methyltransferase